MCPSYIATLDEVHTTRGRAHLLHEMVTGELIRDRWDSEAVLGSLDLCLGCKGCKKECPVGVDLATYRSEFLYQHYRGKVRPRAAYAMGFIERWARLAQTAPHVANALATVPPFGPLLKAAAGIAQQRHFPTFAARTASEALRKRKPIFGEGDRGGVVLLVDVFHDHFYPRALLAAAAALEALGYAVVVPPRRPPAARPLLHFGFLEEAKVALRAAIGVLAPYVAAGARVVGIEPSTVSVFRDDLVALLPGDDDARRVGGAVRSLPELLLDDDVPLPTAAGEVLLHEHCHQKAVLLSGASKRLLERMGRTVCEPEPGCCGMAGAFGFEANHFDISMTIAEKHLLPAVRAAGPEVPVVVEGFSCREQIAQGTGRTVRHLAELLAEQTAPGPHRVTEEETR